MIYYFTAYTPEKVNDGALTLTILATGLTVLAALIYIVGSRGWWRRELLGVAFALILVAPVPVFGIILGRRIFGTYPGYEWVAWVGYSITVVIHLIALIAIVVEQRRGNHTPPSPAKAERPESSETQS